ncbi:cytochrome c oxidase subunit 7A2, mitochondrial [Lampris incognitus]|uniref:cytochrome c oxidase subunit 7A2, mitochondrial n=1 Tax=Lampris incognitus TaxID=2546036 RepID=UPI0024B57EE0|nr:cytochrome c oxidase subunit 7A2, mitochondrial [Lampris incognitus]
MNHLLKVPLLARRTFSISARQLRNKVPEAQKLFQEDNGLPVHIKGGTADVLLYRATMTLTIAGSCYSLYWLLVASMPQKNS